ncbi:MAG: glycosyltransferase family 4 protein [Chloroflexi bacterium]|nr:glycosyltransferase family 4 protein [Chloroflexota bacterium]
MRVMLWSEFYFPDVGGLEVWAYNLMQALRPRGFEFVVLASHGGKSTSDEDLIDGVPVYRFPLLQALEKRDLMAFKRATQRIKAIHAEFQPDVIHINCLPCSFLYFRAGLDKLTPTFTTLHALRITGEGINRLMSELFRASHAITAVSRYILESALTVAPDILPRAEVVYNGKPLPSLAPAPLSLEPPVFLLYGRWVHDKGFDTGIEAFRLLAAEYPLARLWIAGHGLKERALKEQTAQLGLTSQVEFLGVVAPEEIPGLLNQTSAVLVPSRWEEPFGLVALEAGQMARPVIASRAGGLPEVVADGQTGLLVPKEDPAALAGAMRWLLDHPARAVEMGQAGRARAETMFGFEPMVARFEALYRQTAAMPIFSSLP